MGIFRSDDDDTRDEEGSPPEGGTRVVPLLPLRDIVVFPHMIVPLFVGREKSVRALEDVMADDKQILLSSQIDPAVDDPTTDGIYNTGVLANVLQLLKLPDGTVKVLVEGAERVRLNVECRVEPLCRQAGICYHRCPAEIRGKVVDDLSGHGELGGHFFPGIGFGTAIDSLAAIKKLVFDDGVLTMAQLERVVEHGHMVGGGARSGVAATEHSSECFTGGIEVGEQRVKPEPTLVGRRRVFLVRMRTDQGGIDVDHVEPRIRTRRPRLRPYYLQGAAVHERRRRGVSHGPEPLQ